MTMTEQEFNEWIETEDGDSSFYEYLYDAYPSSSDDGIINMMESGLYVEEFMDHLGVICDEKE